MAFNTPAYIAMKSKADGLWMDTGERVAETGGLILKYDRSTGATNDKDGPPPPTPATTPPTPPWSSYYAPVREFRAKAVREFGGINSSGGPQTSGRSDQTDFVVEQSVNRISPKIFEYCCSATQLSWVHLCVDEDDTSTGGSVNRMLHIAMRDVSITSCEFSTGRYFGDTFTGDSSTIGQSRYFERKPHKNGCGRIVRYTLLYTAIAFVYDTGTGGALPGGWDTGTDTAWTNP